MKITKLKRTYTAVVVLAVLVSSLCIFSGTSVATPAWVYIHVEYEDGAPVSGANVTLTSQVTGASSLNLVTDSNGNCTFNPGIYEPGGLIINYGEIVRATAIIGDYSGYYDFTFSTNSSSLIKEWVNITLKEPEKETISSSALLGVGLGIGISLLIIIVILYERASKKGGKKK